MMMHILQWLCTYVPSLCSKCFICIRRMLQVFSSGCYKSRSGLCIYMYVARVCFKCFIRLLQVFHLDVTYVCNDFQVRCFASVSYACFKYFICLLLYVATVASECFKSRSSVAHGMRVVNGWRHGRHPRRHGLAR
jgi:hypothetical protein